MRLIYGGIMIGWTTLTYLGAGIAARSVDPPTSKRGGKVSSTGRIVAADLTW